MDPVDPTVSITTKPVFIIRQYTAEDHDQIVDMFIDGMLAYPEQMDTPFIEDYIRRSLETDLSSMHETYFASGGNFWVITPEDSPSLVVGSVGFEPNSNGEGELRRMPVKSGYRRYGLGRLLISTLEQWAVTEGFRKVWLTTGTVMKKAHGFYEANGYCQVEVVEMMPPHKYLAVKFEKTLMALCACIRLTSHSSTRHT